MIPAIGGFNVEAQADSGVELSPARTEVLNAYAAGVTQLILDISPYFAPGSGKARAARPCLPCPGNERPREAIVLDTCRL